MCVCLYVCIVTYVCVGVVILIILASLDLFLGYSLLLTDFLHMVKSMWAKICYRGGAKLLKLFNAVIFPFIGTAVSK